MNLLSIVLNHREVKGQEQSYREWFSFSVSSGVRNTFSVNIFFVLGKKPHSVVSNNVWFTRNTHKLVFLFAKSLENLRTSQEPVLEAFCSSSVVCLQSRNSSTKVKFSVEGTPSDAKFFVLSSNLTSHLSLHILKAICNLMLCDRCPRAMSQHSPLPGGCDADPALVFRGHRHVRITSQILNKNIRIKTINLHECCEHHALIVIYILEFELIWHENKNQKCTNSL